MTHKHDQELPYITKMGIIYFIIILGCSIAIPILIHKPIKKKIKSSIALLTIEILISLTILLVGFLIPLFTFFSLMPEYPIVTKKINDKYYFSQQEYGWVGSMPGKHLYFYEKTKYWFDKEVGHIQWQIGTGNMNVKIEDINFSNKKRLIVEENNKLALDTILPFDKKFDFTYLALHK